jgi:signal transduction histidine kinase
MLPHVALGKLLLSSSEAAALRAEVARLDTARSAAASAESTSLRRIERDLHDGPQQRLIRLAMDVQSAERAMDTDPVAAREALASARQQSTEALAELRALTRGIAPPLLAERGLAAAIDSLASLSTVPVSVDVQPGTSVSLGAETAAYFVVSESLANLAKHAAATKAAVTVTVTDGVLRVTVTDDGRGGAHVAKGRGLAGLADRVAGVGGSLAVADAQAGGTVVTAEIPCA